MLAAVRDTGEKTADGVALWESLCDCGNTVVLRKHAVTAGKVLTAVAARSRQDWQRMKHKEKTILATGCPISSWRICKRRWSPLEIQMRLVIS